MAKNAKIKLRQNENIGDTTAEHDIRYLRECFVSLPIIEDLLDHETHRCLLLGRTGAGKSAILWHIENSAQNTSRIIPKDASFQYIANSTIIKTLRDLGVDLHVFYEYLWKHILCVHIIRECLGVTNDENAISLLCKLEAFVTRDRRKLIVLQYLTKHKDHFWESADVISREVTTGIAKNLSSSVGISVEALHGKIEDASGWKEEEKKSFKDRAQNIVNALQMRELNETIST